MRKLNIIGIYIITMCIIVSICAIAWTYSDIKVNNAIQDNMDVMREFSEAAKEVSGNENL